MEQVTPAVEASQQQSVQSTPAAPATPPTPPSNNDGNNDGNNDEVVTLRAELAEMKAKLDATITERDTERLASAVKAAATPAPRLNNTQQDMRRDKLVAAVGGLGRFKQLPLSERCKLMGYPTPSQADISDAAQYFGPNGSGAALATLAKTNQGRYSFLRFVYGETR